METLIKNTRDEDFLNEYKEAIEESKLYNTIEQVKILITELLENPDSAKLKIAYDPLINVINYCITLGISLDIFINEKALEIFNINVPGAIIIGNELTIDIKYLQFLKGTKYIHNSRMLVFNDKSITLCDVSNCSQKELEEQYNHEAIKGIDKFKEKHISTVKDSNKILNYIMESTYQASVVIEDENN